MEECHFQACRGMQSGVDGSPRCFCRGGDERGSLVNELGCGLGAIIDLECHPDSCAGSAARFDRVDHPCLGGIREFKSGSPRVEDRDSGVVLSFECSLLRQPENIAVEGQRFVKVLGLNNETELPDGWLGC